MYEDTFDETEELTVEELNNVLTEMENLEEQMLEEEERRVIQQEEEVYDDENEHEENEHEENYHEMHEEENNTPTNTSSSSSSSSPTSSSDETNNDDEQQTEEEQEQQKEEEQEFHECVVCYKQAKPLETIKAPCGHIHCSDCFFRWISINPTCTICRTSIVSFEKYIQNRDVEQEMETTNRIMYEMSKAIDEKREVYSALEYQIKGG